MSGFAYANPKATARSEFLTAALSTFTEKLMASRQKKLTELAIDQTADSMGTAAGDPQVGELLRANGRMLLEMGADPEQVSRGMQQTVGTLIRTGAQTALEEIKAQNRMNEINARIAGSNAPARLRDQRDELEHQRRLERIEAEKEANLEVTRTRGEEQRTTESARPEPTSGSRVGGAGSTRITPPTSARSQSLDNPPAGLVIESNMDGYDF